jgi:hypothetical protein
MAALGYALRLREPRATKPARLSSNLLRTDQIQLIPIYVRQRTEPLQEKKDYCS